MTKTNRKALGKKIRFEIFKRDSFTCQYCGNKAPDVVLVIDHIKPVASGGSNDIMNLITSCFDCNSGKSNNEISDNSVVQKRLRQAEQLQERREQIELMAKWQADLLSLDEDTINAVCEIWNQNIQSSIINDRGRKIIQKLINKYGFQEVLTATRVSIQNYIDAGDHVIFKRISGICETRKREKIQPGYSRLYYIRGILRNRLDYISENRVIYLLADALKSGKSTDDLEDIAKTVESWNEFVVRISEE